MYGGLNVSGNKFGVGLVFRCVYLQEGYTINDDTMIVETRHYHNNILHGVL